MINNLNHNYCSRSKISIIKKIVFLLMAFLLSASSSFAQQGNVSLTEPMPEFSIYTVDDSTEFNTAKLKKKGIILIKVFSPDCDHCQEEAKKYYENKESLKKIKTIWVTGSWTPLTEIEKFIEEYKIDELNSIAIGKDTGDFLLKYFGIDGIPYGALYIHDQLVFAKKGTLDFEELIAIAAGNYEK